MTSMQYEARKKRRKTHIAFDTALRDIETQSLSLPSEVKSAPVSVNEAASSVNEEFDFDSLSEDSLDYDIEANTESECQMDSDDSTGSGPNFSLAEDLFKFMVMFNCGIGMMTFLLNLLIRHGIEAPRSVYLLKKQCQSSVVLPKKQIFEDGKMAHLSIVDNVLFSIRTKGLQLKKAVSKISIQFFIDGMPVFHSSRIQLWPILMRILPSPSEYSVKPSHLLPVSIFCGFGKPKLGHFIERLVQELRVLKTEPTFDTTSGNKFIVSDVYFIADSPARAFLQNVVNHGGYYACPYCRVKGKYHINHMVYEDVDSTSRTDEMYAEFKENNQYSLSPLANVVPLRSSFPVEYMHNICIGIVKKILAYFFFSQKATKLPCKITEGNKVQVSHDIRHFSKYLPSEFNRKLRPLNDFRHYKATEFRTFLLYFFPIFMHAYVPQRYFRHFLYLHFSVYSLLTDRAKEYADVAEACFRNFFIDLKRLYGCGSQVFNMHILLHLPEFVRAHGSLDNFSAFPSENYMRLIKRRIRSGNCIFEQTANNLTVLRDLYSSKEERKLHYSTKPPNNCCMTASGEIVSITECHEDGTFSGCVFENPSDLYVFPYSSLSHSIGIYELSTRCVRRINPVNKCICIPLKKKFVIFPLASKTCLC